MTLCIAWKSDTSYLLSDSRITFSTNSSSDIGIKVYSIPVNIYTSAPQGGLPKLAFSSVYGMCAAGLGTNTYVVKELMSEILCRLQFTSYTDTSITGVCKVISKLYGHVSQKICEHLGEKGLIEFFLSGKCPQFKKIRLFHFSMNTNTYPIEPQFVELDASKPNSMYFIGSGSKEAATLHSAKPSLNAFHLIEEIIKSGSVPSVGGFIQAGRFESDSFVIKGVIHTREGKSSTAIRGTELYSVDYEDFGLFYSFLTPFVE